MRFNFLRNLLLVALLSLTGESLSRGESPEDGSVLPFPPPKSGSIAASSTQDSKYSPLPVQRLLPPDVPNILIVLVDDAGPGLPDTYGGEVHTPTLTRIAQTGISYNRFHTTAMCSPTRASLLTGRNHHRVGAGVITKLGNDWDGYTGMWPATSASLARVLGCYGYATSAFGKWHNTPDDQVSQVGPFDRWPTGRLVGFDHFYGFLAGESSQYEPKLVENFAHLPSREHGDDYHLTEDLADRAITWLRRQRAQAPDQPFLMYWAPGGVHGPHQVARRWADAYKGKFDDGWDKYRERVFQRQKERGYLPPDAKLTARPSTLPAWDDIPEAEKPFQRRLMEVFAGFCEHTDAQAGRVIDELERLGIRDNTLVLYIWGDNGSSAEGQAGTVSEYLAQSGTPSTIADHLRVLNEFGGLEALGGPQFESMYHAGWAWAGSTPYKSTKLVAAHFGGTRNPLAISWPKQIRPDAQVRSQFHHVNDIVPTIYEILSIPHPTVVDGVTQDSMDGTSMRYTFDSASVPGRKRSQYFEIMGSRAYYRDGWIASAFGPRVPWVSGIDVKVFSWDPDEEPWELYHLESDFTQADDLAQQQPKKLQELVTNFLEEARSNKVFPIGGGLWTGIHPEFAKQNPAREFFYTADVIEVPEATAPRIAQRSNLVTIDAQVEKDTRGVLYASGCMSGGLAVWIDEGTLTYEYNLYHIDRTRIRSTSPLPSGPLKIEVESKFAAGVRNGPADIVLRVNGQVVGQGKVPRTTGYALSGNDSFDVGRDSFSPVSPLYADRAPFAFSGKIDTVTIRYTTER
jgi:arylsulfatase